MVLFFLVGIRLEEGYLGGREVDFWGFIRDGAVLV